MKPNESGPARVAAQVEARSYQICRECSSPCTCATAPLCAAIRVSVCTTDGQTIELGWAHDHGDGLLVAVHAHETGGPLFAVDVPLGLLLKSWTPPPSLTRSWTDGRTNRKRTSRLELLADGSVQFNCTEPDAGVLIDAAMMPSFKEAVGLLLTLADKTVANRDANLTDAGGSLTTYPCCPHCTSERGCRTSDIGVTHCIGSEEGAIGRTRDGCFVHVAGYAATRVRIADNNEESR